MRYIEIAGIERPVSVIGLGTTSKIFTPSGDDTVAELIDAYLAVGGNCIDTAHIYGLGESEKALGRWLEQSGRRDDIALITKGCHPRVDEAGRFGPPRVNAGAIHNDLSESLERLGTDHVDLYLLHRDDETVPPGPLLEALNEEIVNGRIAACGASNWTVERIALANEYSAEKGLTGFAASSPGLSLPRPVEMQFPGTLFADDEPAAGMPTPRCRCSPGPRWQRDSPTVASGPMTRTWTKAPEPFSQRTTSNGCGGPRKLLSYGTHRLSRSPSPSSSVRSIPLSPWSARRRSRTSIAVWARWKSN